MHLALGSSASSHILLLVPDHVIFTVVKDTEPFEFTKDLCLARFSLKHIQGSKAL